MECGKHRVARLRKQAGIEARRKRRFRLTVENHAMAPAAPNLVQRRFYARTPNRIWVGDTTFIRTRGGFLHLAVLLDLYSRRVVGWSMGDKPDLAVVMGALQMALQQRQPPRGLIHHSDQGALYAARGYRETMQAHGLKPSMSAKGNAYDNAVAESFFSNLKNELVHHCDFETRDAARGDLRLHRTVLQSSAHPSGARLRQPSTVRESCRCILIKPSGKPRSAQSVPTTSPTTSLQLPYNFPTTSTRSGRRLKARGTAVSSNTSKLIRENPHVRP
jgi:transposase InsO family protein